MRGCGCSAMRQAPAASAAAITSVRTKRIMRKLRTASSSTAHKRKLNGDRCAEFLPARHLAQVAALASGQLRPEEAATLLGEWLLVACARPTHEAASTSAVASSYGSRGYLHVPGFHHWHRRGAGA